MMIREERHLTVPGRFESLARISEFVTAAAKSAGLAEDDVFHVEMAVDEACSNVIEHAYSQQSGNIELTCSADEAGCEKTRSWRCLQRRGRNRRVGEDE